MSCKHTTQPCTGVPCSQCDRTVRVERVPPPGPRIYSAAERARLDAIIRRISGGRGFEEDGARPPRRKPPRLSARERAAQAQAWALAGDTLDPRVPRVPREDLAEREREICRARRAPHHDHAGDPERSAVPGESPAPAPIHTEVA